MKIIGIADTTFARSDMAADAVGEIKKTISGFRSLELRICLWHARS
jgi:riboflavin synthase